MGKLKFSASEVIEQAIRTERLGNKFYRDLAKRFKENPDLSGLFGTLADKESLHEAKFRELKEEAGSDAPEGSEEISEYMRAFVESEFFLGSDKALARMKKVSTAGEAISNALNFEKETLLYFVGLRDMVGRKKALVDAIIREERTHISWLNKWKSGKA